MGQRFSITWEIPAEKAGIIIRDFLKEQAISKTALADIKFKGGDIIINGETVNVRYPLKSGDVLKLIFPKEEPSQGIVSEKIPLNILFEDEYVMVVNKPAGMSTIPSREHPTGSLANALLGYYESIGLSATAHIVTRLDRDTSGLVLIAKHRHVHHLFSQQQQKGGVKRIYEAFASGVILDNSGTIEKPIARSKESIIERVVDPEGQYACTHFRVLKRCSTFTHVELKLETGRTRQIRVHLKFLGHPLLGDDLYDGPIDLIARQALHCREIRFLHPVEGREYDFKAALPEDMRNLL